MGDGHEGYEPDEMDEDGRQMVDGPDAWQDQVPSYEELVEMLDNVSATLDNVLLSFAQHMTPADRQRRTEMCRSARTLCDHLLRYGQDDEPDSDELRVDPRC